MLDFVDKNSMNNQIAEYINAVRGPQRGKYCGLGLRGIGEHFNVRDTAISEASRRFARELERDEKLREVVARLKVKLIKCRM